MRVPYDLHGRGFTEEDARAQLDTATDRGRHGELFHYDADCGEFALTPANAADHAGARPRGQISARAP